MANNYFVLFGTSVLNGALSTVGFIIVYHIVRYLLTNGTDLD